ncbi:Biotin synthase, mitochondrial [Wickerhamomyces ciferrii]|uniref:biotin synthase n=1 Tax=Wickerhamomyces ciferrii (strain ATCC 14091 / BCRC 22168 / CBS 111 / JCM 3599 / NBRC 0793 / NRRL Y-1031 F-60-10) TaxID=1206466 RepID=K0KRC1_WICCF|nr:Biotin synthase, mitochondrial [Wickerhamomyces ciferrii]CCH43858.1 Biotin synthase, mitochondrial [Wickerhamomyces ciferrii]
MRPNTINTLVRGLRPFHSSIKNASPPAVSAAAVEMDPEPEFFPPTPSKSALELAMTTNKPLHAWSREQIKEIYQTPLIELMHSAQLQHRKYHDPTKVQLCTLMNIKSGGCTEDCKYCSQSNRYSKDTGVKAERMVQVDEVIEAAKEAKANGSTRFCMGAAWREMTGRKNGLKKVGEMVKAVHDMGMESCVTLGMINEEQAKELKDAGLTAYNHNIDTSREHYKKVITTRSYDQRLKTIKNVQNSGIKACTGGILGLGETEDDHVGFLYTLSNMSPHPESLPINRLVPIKGTPMYEEVKHKRVKLDAIVRTIATARLIMPEAIIRLAAGRYTMKEHEQAMCFMSGCNAVFTGKQMLTTQCNGWDEDKAMLKRWGLEPMESFSYKPKEVHACSA